MRLVYEYIWCTYDTIIFRCIFEYFIDFEYVPSAHKPFSLDLEAWQPERVWHHALRVMHIQKNRFRPLEVETCLDSTKSTNLQEYLNMHHLRRLLLLAVIKLLIWKGDGISFKVLKSKLKIAQWNQELILSHWLGWWCQSYGEKGLGAQTCEIIPNQTIENVSWTSTDITSRPLFRCLSIPVNTMLVSHITLIISHLLVLCTEWKQAKISLSFIIRPLNMRQWQHLKPNGVVIKSSLRSIESIFLSLDFNHFWLKCTKIISEQKKNKTDIKLTLSPSSQISCIFTPDSWHLLPAESHNCTLISCSRNLSLYTVIGWKMKRAHSIIIILKKEFVWVN